MHTRAASQPQSADSTNRWASVQAGMEQVEAYAHVLPEADVVLFSYVLTEFAPQDAGGSVADRAALLPDCAATLTQFSGAHAPPQATCASPQPAVGHASRSAVLAGC